MKKNLVRKSEQIVRITLLLILLTQFHGALKSQFSNVKDLRQQIKSGTYNKNLIVPKGVLVVCKNATVKFGTGYGIIVKRGGTLYLDNCTITHANDNFTNPNSINKCGDYWKGIFVEGSPDTTQEVQYRKTCNLLENCVNYKNGGLDSAWGIGDYWDNNPFTHYQGLVYARNARIRQAVIGINLGDLKNGQSNHVEPDGTQGGGLLIATNCKFSNFSNSAISFAPYNKFSNLSFLENDTFECASMVSSAGFVSMRGLISSFNTFKFSIYGNCFLRSNTSKWTFDKGIDFFNCFASIYNCKFQNLTQGIFMNTAVVSLSKSIEVFNNSAVDCNNFFEGWDSDLSSVFDNIISVKNIANLSYRFASNVLFNCKDATIRNNQIRASNPATNMNSIGICIGAKSSNPPKLPRNIICFGNSITGLSNAIAHDQDARGNIPDCNVLKCNVLFTSSIFDIGHSNNLYNFPVNFGSKNNPLSNSFTLVSQTSNFKNLWSNNLAYNYYYNSNNMKYNPYTSAVISKFAGANISNACQVAYLEKVQIRERCVGIKNPITLKDKIPNALFGRKNLDSSGNSKWDYYLAKSKYLQIFQKNLQDISIDYSDTLKSLYISKIDTLLETIPDTSDYFYYSAFHYLLHNNISRWNNLKSQINGLLPMHSELNYLTDYIEIVKSLTDSNFNNRNNSNIHNLLDTIANSNSWVSGKAKALGCYLYGLNCSMPMANYGDTSNLQMFDSIVYNFGPNPFDNNFTISVTNKYSSIKSVQLSIASFSNITPFYNNIINVLPGTTATINISTNTWASDNYALLLSYPNYYHSEIIYKP